MEQSGVRSVLHISSIELHISWDLSHSCLMVCCTFLAFSKTLFLAAVCTFYETPLVCVQRALWNKCKSCLKQLSYILFFIVRFYSVKASNLLKLFVCPSYVLCPSFVRQTQLWAGRLEVSDLQPGQTESGSWAGCRGPTAIPEKSSACQGRAGKVISDLSVDLYRTSQTICGLSVLSWQITMWRNNQYISI